jgi:glutamyl-tRNA synthetase
VLVTRIAPTPSGFLHPGNAVNFVLTAWLAAQHSGRLLLRIDDMDAARVRTAYLEDVFRVLDWLGIVCDEGPADVAQFRREYSLTHRTELYRDELQRLRQRGLIYACRCSRRELAGHPGDVYPGTCRSLGLPLVCHESAARLAVPRPCLVVVPGTGPVDVAEVIGDAVLWRRDDLPAYQLASVVEDRDLGVNAIVRGLDLLPSTSLQLHLAPLLGADALAAADIRHHALVRAPDGTKLSKSAGRQSQSMAGDRALRAFIVAAAVGMAPAVGIEPPA